MKAVTDSSGKTALVEELHKPARRNFKRRKVVTKGINDLWQADLVEMGEYASENMGYRFLLTVIDTFSKYAWAVPLKTKSALEVTTAMKNIFKKINVSPKNIQTDLGKEFYNKDFQKLLRNYKVNHYSTYTVLKASIVERFNRTLKQMMWKKFSLNGSYRWIDIIQNLIQKYNNTVHRTTKMKPAEVSKKHEKRLLATIYNNNIKIYPKSKFKVGDYVRISKFKHVFEKGYTPNWTTEIFQIKTAKYTNPATFILRDFTGQVIEGGFYEEELQKAKHSDIYLVEKVLKQKKNKIFVKWLGFSDKYNSWIDRKDIL